MSKRKYPRELKGEFHARRLGAGVCVVMIAGLFYAFGFRHAGFNAPTSARILAVLPVGVLLLAWYRRGGWNYRRWDVRICEQCNRVEVDNVEGRCFCGGAFLPLPEKKWMEAPPSAAAASPSQAKIESAASLSQAA
jgi:hypothetical protein